MLNLKSFILFSSLIALIYVLRSYNDPTYNIANHQRLLAALKDKYCSSVTDSSQPTASDISNAANFRTQFFNVMRKNDNQLKTALQNSDWLGYVKSLIYPTIPWLVFLALSIIGWISYCCCCCCDKCCPPCGFCRRDIEKKPYKGFELWGVVLFIIIFGIGIIGLSVAGIIYSTQIQNGIQNSVCSLASLYDYTVYGTTYNSTNWIGISPVMSKITNIMNQLSSMPNKFYSTFGDISWIDYGINNLLMENRNMYPKYKNSQLSSPNPADSSNVVPSTFIQTLLGPYTQNGTMTQSIDTQFQYTSMAFSSSLKGVYSSSKNVADNSADISTTLNSSSAQILALYNSLKGYESQIDSTLNTPQTYFTKINDGFYASWSVNIFSSLLGIFGALGVYLFKWPRARILLHCSWCFMSLLMCIGFALASVFVPIGIMTIEGCDLYQSVITQQKEYEKYTSLIPADINAKLETCLFGSGDLSIQFGMKDQVTQLDSIQNNFNTLNKLPSSGNFSLNQSDLLLDYWTSETDARKNGLRKDSLFTDDNDSFVSIASFNDWSDYSVSNSKQYITCQLTQDQWVFNFSNCTYSQNWSSTNSPGDHFGEQICIQIQDFDYNSVSTRYSNMGSCSSSVSQNDLSYFSSLKNYDDARRTLFGNIEINLGSLKTDNDNYNSKLKTFNTTVYGYIANINDFISNVSDPTSGLAYGFNCQFLRSTAQESYNSMCVSFFTPVYLQIIFICTTSMTMFLMSLLAYLAGMRFGVLHKKNDVDTWGGSKN